MLSLISDPYFVRKYCLRSNHRQRIPVLLLQGPFFIEFIYLDGRKVDCGDVNVPFKINPFNITLGDGVTSMEIVQSCNGLLLLCRCRSSFKSLTIDIDNLTHYICNPYTRHKRLPPLPPSPIRTQPRSVCSVSLAFDPLKSPNYKAICIWKNYQGNYQIEIYSSETATWRLSGEAFSAPCDLFNRSGVFWNGSLHWVHISSPRDESSLYFDIDQELVKEMPLPPVPDGHDFRRIEYFGECRGHMHLIEIYDPRNTVFDILEMENDYTGWNVKYHVHLPDSFGGAYPNMVEYTDSDVSEFGYYFKFYILLVEDGEEVTPKLVLHIRSESKVISCDLKDESFKEIHDFARISQSGFSPQYYLWYDAHQCIESLAGV